MLDKNTSDNSNVAQHAKVSKNVSVSAYQRLGLDLGKSGKVSISVSSRTGSETSRSRLGLGPQRLVYIPASRTVDVAAFGEKIKSILSAQLLKFANVCSFTLSPLLHLKHHHRHHIKFVTHHT